MASASLCLSCVVVAGATGFYIYWQWNCYFKYVHSLIMVITLNFTLLIHIYNELINLQTSHHDKTVCRLLATFTAVWKDKISIKSRYFHQLQIHNCYRWHRGGWNISISMTIWVRKIDMRFTFYLIIYIYCRYQKTWIC